MRAVPDDVLAGKYRVVRMLGEGGMGIVAEAMHLGLGHRVAIKLLKSELVRPEHRERFFREARAAGSLRSDHVVAIKDVDTLPDGTPFLVMEYLEGADLGSVVAHRGALPAEEVCDHLLQACHAVAEAHSLGIVHRDLKPANLFLTRRPDGAPLVKVLDFGIAKVAGPEAARDLTSTSQYMGSPSYMSPEQVRSAKRVDARSDIWALGVVLFELLVGALPFDGETAGDMLVKISTEPPRPFTPPVPSPWLEAIVLRCLEKDPERRYRDVAELAAALAPFAGASGRSRAEAVARVIGRELPAMAPVGPSFPPPIPPSLPATLTTLGLSAGQSQAARIRPRRGLAYAALAIAIVGAAATWGYLRVAPELRSARQVAPAPESPTTAPAAPPAATPRAAALPAAAPPAAEPPAAALLAAEPPAAEPSASALSGAAPPAAEIPTDAATADVPSAETAIPTAQRPPRKPPRPARRPAKPGTADSEFLEERR